MLASLELGGGSTANFNALFFTYTCHVASDLNAKHQI